MTVIAWDGKTLAADKRSTAGNQHNTVTKLFRIDADRIAAVAGGFAHSLMVLDWVRRGEDHQHYPKPLDSDEAGRLLVVHRSGVIEVFEAGPIALRFEDPTFTMGSGAQIASTAMHLGHDAASACRIACDVCIYCGNGIDVLTFEELTLTDRAA